MAYLTVDEVRAEGLTVAQASDERVEDLILFWSKFIEEACGQWFEPRALTVQMDGNDSNILHLMVPIVQLDALYLNGDTSPLPADRYVAYNGRALPDDRRNPKVKLNGFRRDIFRPGGLSHDGAIFRKGARNQKLVGTFGFTEEGDGPPPLIKRALLRLVLKNPAPLADGGGAPATSQFVKSESTDGHSITYATPSELGSSSGGTLGITGDAEVERILKMYRRPMAVGAPGALHYSIQEM